MYVRIHQCWRQCKTWLKWLYPSDSLKVFPPRFHLRDFAGIQAEKWMAKGRDAVLFYVALAPSPGTNPAESAAFIERYAAGLIRTAREVIGAHFPADDLLVARQELGSEYVVLVKEADPPLPNDLRLEQLHRFVRLLEIRWNHRLDGGIPAAVRLEASWTRVEAAAGEAGVVLYQAVQRARALARQGGSLAHGPEAEIRRIIAEEDIRVLTQPIVSLSTCRVEGWEVLTRGPRLSAYEQPNHLFRTAHEVNLLLPLELLVVKKALEQFCQRRTTVPVFINVTAPSLVQPAYYEEIMRLLRQYPGMHPESITLEITERHAVDNFADFRRSVEAYRRAGFKIAIDDTGAGYSSLHMISEVLPDFMKIDRSIIQDIDAHEVKDSILQALLYVAEKIGCHVVAEGVETEAEAALLLKRNVTFGQGYFFARPSEPAAEAFG